MPSKSFTTTINMATAPDPIAARSLVTLPADILINIMQDLSSLDDLFSLAATCHALNSVWVHHIGPIFNTIAPRDITQLPAARDVLSRQKGGLNDTTARITRLKDARQMWLNARRMRSSMAFFEDLVHNHIQCNYRLAIAQSIKCLHPDLYRTRSKAQPEVFEWAYYTIWYMLLLDNSDDTTGGGCVWNLWRSILGKLSLQRLYYLAVMSSLPMPIGDRPSELASAVSNPDELTKLSLDLCAKGTPSSRSCWNAHAHAFSRNISRWRKDLRDVISSHQVSFWHEHQAYLNRGPHFLEFHCWCIGHNRQGIHGLMDENGWWSRFAMDSEAPQALLAWAQSRVWSVLMNMCSFSVPANPGSVPHNLEELLWDLEFEIETRDQAIYALQLSQGLFRPSLSHS